MYPTTSGYINRCKVLEYLSKKGYVRTEAMLRKESEQPQGANGGPSVSRENEAGAAKYKNAFGK